MGNLVKEEKETGVVTLDIDEKSRAESEWDSKGHKHLHG